MTIGQTIAAPAKLTLAYSEAILKDVTPAIFARHASPGGKVIVSNHPAWVFGHCGLYNARILGLVNQPPGVAVNPANWETLFKNGTECKDDPAGTIYPAMNVITAHFFNGFKAAMQAVEQAPDAILKESNPAEGRMKELFPTKGQMIAFLLAGHPMSHMGQVSAWRRMQGLASAL